MEDSVDRHVAHWSKELDWLDPVKEAIIARLMIVSRHATALHRDTLRSDSLTHGEFKILLALRRQGRPYQASPSQLADDLGLTRGALSARLGPMEHAGLITRTTHTDDRRRVRVGFTRAGRTAFEQHLHSEERGESALLDVLTVRERERLADILRKLVLAVEAH